MQKVQHGRREHDAETRSAIEAATAGLGPDLQEKMLEGSKEEAVVGAELCGGVKCKKVGHFKCSRCRTTKYCSKECQKSAWK